MKEYTILESTSLSHLIYQVNNHMKEGWELQGGVSTGKANRLNNNIFLQAMIRNI